MSDLQGYILDSNYGRVPTILEDQGDGTWSVRQVARNMVWDPIGLTWKRQESTVGGGGSGPVTIADGADTVEGTLADAAITTDVNGTVSGKLRGIVKLLAGTLTVAGTVTANLGTIAGIALDATVVAVRDRLPASLDADGGLKTHVQNFPATQPVSGTFWQATQPVSATALPLPAGAAADSSLTTIDTDLKATQPRDVTDRAGRLVGVISGTVAVSNPTANPETGLAKDATIQTNLGLTTDAQATESGDTGSAIAQLKRIRDTSFYTGDAMQQMVQENRAQTRLLLLLANYFTDNNVEMSDMYDETGDA